MNQRAITKCNLLCIQIVLAIFGLVGLASAQVSVPLKVVKETRLPDKVYHLVAIGGPSDGIACDMNRNLWIPALRGYSDTVSSLVRYSPRTGYLQFDIDKTPQFENASVEYFWPQDDGGVLVLIRTVTKYSKIYGHEARPEIYSDSYAVKYTAQGSPFSITKLQVPKEFSPTGLAELSDGWLLVGSAQLEKLILIRALTFDKTGKFRSELNLPNNQSKPSRERSAPTVAVFRPKVVPMTDGTILLLRGYTSQPIYRISTTGLLVGSVKLNPDELSFWSPRPFGNQMLVQAEVGSVKLGDLGGIPILQHRAAFPIYDLSTGSMTEVLTFNGYGTVGCYDSGSSTLTLIRQEIDRAGGSYWKVEELEPEKSRAPAQTS